MLSIFDQLGQSLLILGEPGTGKTTMLLDLAEQLLDRAGDDPSHPIPVVLNLSTWAADRKPLAVWLADELNKRYQVPPRIAQDWVAADEILPLLDGLDEVAEAHRQDCAKAINAFRQEHGLLPIAVCSRVEEYEGLVARLQLTGAVRIQPLDREQVDAYLARAHDQLASVREALRSDDTLYELFETPLMLSVAALASLDTQTVVAVGTVEQKRSQLFAAYVEAMFQRRSKDSRYTSRQCERWLAWLASKMVTLNQTVFYLERLEPYWLPLRRQRWVVTWGVAVGLALFSGLLSGLVAELLFGPVGGLVVASVVALAVVLFGWSSEGFILMAATLGWSWTEVRELWHLLLVCVLVGVLVGGIAGGLVGGLGAGLAGMLIGGLVFTLVFGLAFGLQRGKVPERLRPDEGIRRSAIGGVLVGLTFGLAFGLVVGMISGFVVGMVSDLVSGLVFGLAFGLVFGLPFGMVLGLEYGGRAYLQHILLRHMLWQWGRAPRQYVRFLDHAVDRVLLRKVGRGYIFIHRALMEWFARRWYQIQEEIAALEEARE
jgi:hypothetical protein